MNVIRMKAYMYLSGSEELFIENLLKIIYEIGNI